MEMLTLPIKRKWFDMIASGEKKEEYRALTDYYDTRFTNVPRFLDDRSGALCRERNTSGCISPESII